MVEPPAKKRRQRDATEAGSSDVNVTGAGCENSVVQDNETLRQVVNDKLNQDTAERRIRILYLFSGPVKSDRGFKKQCENLGMECTCIDIEYDSSHNLLDQDFWESLEQAG